MLTIMLTTTELKLMPALLIKMLWCVLWCSSKECSLFLIPVIIFVGKKEPVHNPKNQKSFWYHEYFSLFISTGMDFNYKPDVV